MKRTGGPGEWWFRNDTLPSLKSPSKVPTGRVERRRGLVCLTDVGGSV